MQSKGTRGFTLVELSIVLVILGLLVGGVLTGQSLIRAAELRSITTQYNGFQTALNTFRDKYFAIPGDMNNAQSFWGIAHATPATCVTTASTTTATCNGDGDGIIEEAAAGSNEVFRFWQHLANAGLIEGNFSGITQGSTAVSATAANSPRSKLNGGYWFTYYWGTLSGNGFFFDGVYNHTIVLGALQANTWPATALLKTEDLWNIDKKIDDGKPGLGKVMTTSYAACTTTSSSATTTADYLLTSTLINCGAVFPRAY